MNDTHVISLGEVSSAAEHVAAILEGRFSHGQPLRIYAIPRGGISGAGFLLHQLGKLRRTAVLTSSPEQADVVFDDLVDSGATMARYTSGFKIALFSKREDMPCGCNLPPHRWVVLPWELNTQHSADDIPRRLLQFIGENPERGGLKETPARFLKAWAEWTDGYKKNPASVFKVFEDGAEEADALIVVKDIPVYSHCEHHLAPFFGIAHIGYIPNGKIVGLSKFSRLVDVFAHRLQVQERLTNQIADAFEECLAPRGVAVVLACRHLCMESRGIQRQGSITKTSAMRGLLRDDHAARAEFMELLK